MEFNLANSLQMSLICMAVVFLVLLAIMVIISILGAVLKNTGVHAAKNSAVIGTPATQSVSAPAPSAADPNAVDAEVVAAITAVVSTMVRGPVADIKITKVG